LKETINAYEVLVGNLKKSLEYLAVDGRII